MLTSLAAIVLTLAGLQALLVVRLADVLTDGATARENGAIDIRRRHAGLA